MTMYLSAHRIRLRNRRTGVNVFLNLHGNQRSWPSTPAALLTFLRRNPGVPSRQILEVPTKGGNAVLSSLDILAPDATPRSHIIEIVDLLAASRPDQHGGFLALVRPPLAIRLSIPEWTLPEWRDELEKLVGPAETLLRSWYSESISSPEVAAIPEGIRE